MRDPRVFFAAERTFLAWVRSGLTLMALGFVVARFGLFLTLITATRSSAPSMQHDQWLSSALGVALTLLGVGSILGALHNHRAYVRALPAEDLPDAPFHSLTFLLGLSVAAIGLVLAAYLVIL